jgi:cytochrome c oxidase subunit 2
MTGLPLFPPEGSTAAVEVDRLFLGLIAVSGLTLALVFGLMLTFAVRYRHGSRADRGGAEGKSWRWEVGWTGATLLLFLGLFVWSAHLYLALLQPPAGAIEVLVVGNRWMWKIQHAGGQREINELHVPRGRPVKLVMTSEDVIHSFFLPAFRVKRDVVPGRYQSLWFDPRQDGEFPLLCAEFCGTDHSGMIGRVVVMEPGAFEAWLTAQAPADGLAAQGAALYRSLGCSGCHEGRGPVRAPALAGLYGRPVPLADGRLVTADEGYLRDSILLPQAAVVAGYDPVMPSFAGRLGEDDLARLIAYLKSREAR